MKKRMKKSIFILIIFLTFLHFYMYAEEINTGFMQIMGVLKGESSIKLYWGLSIGSSSDKYPYKMKSQLLYDFNVWLTDEPDSNEIIGQIKEFRFIKEHHEIISSLFKQFGMIGNSLGMFIYRDGQIPIRVAEFSGKPCLLITDVATDKVYNTLRTTSRSRASDILNSTILPELNDFNRGLKDTDIDQFGIIVSYGSKDFLDDYNLSLKGEALCLIVSKIDCAKFINGEITDNELLDNSHIFISDRNMMSGFKKININIE